MIRAPWNIFEGYNSQESSRKVRNEVFCRFGSPKNIVSDNGSHFVNNTLRRLCKEWSIRHVLLSAYHPCPNRAERTNADLVLMIASYLSDSQGKCDFHIHNFVLVFMFNDKKYDPSFPCAYKCWSSNTIAKIQMFKENNAKIIYK
jgi:transposase InsO family protein